MIVGTGQLAKAFFPFDEAEVVFFLSGVSDSLCIDGSQFLREEKLLRRYLTELNDRKFVYVSSCALSSDSYVKNPYYVHKEHMESIIRTFDNYYIFRVPQLFGQLLNHTTLINYLFDCIVNERRFLLYDEACRYVLEINDFVKIVRAFIDIEVCNTVVDLANPYRYSVFEIVTTLEKLLNKTAFYDVVHKQDRYVLDLNYMLNFIDYSCLEFEFGVDYLESKLREKLVICNNF